jgi:hypothetical protein
MLRSVIILASVAFALTSPACARTAQEVHQDCKELMREWDAPNGRPTMNGGRCLGYILGVIDMNGYIRALSIAEMPQFCPPQIMTNSQAVRIFVKFVDDNPERMHHEGPMIAVLAFSKAFPCPR